LNQGTDGCAACTRSFPNRDLRKASRYLALLGPATWQVRQRLYCDPCAGRLERLHAIYVTLVVVGLGLVWLIGSGG